MKFKVEGRRVFPNARRRFSRTIAARFQSRYTAGITTRVNKVALTMPPTIGAAIRHITSDPVPVPCMIGNSPTMMVATVIILGRSRSSLPSICSFA